MTEKRYSSPWLFMKRSPKLMLKCIMFYAGMLIPLLMNNCRWLFMFMEYLLVLRSRLRKRSINLFFNSLYIFFGAQHVLSTMNLVMIFTTNEC